MASGNTTIYDAASLASRMLDGFYDPFARKLYMTGVSATSKGVLQYDADLPFSDADSWKFQDLTSFDAAAAGYAGGVAAGGYVYFAPSESSDYVINSTVARYNNGGFNTEGSWEFADTTSLVHANAAGFRGAIFDGRYVYLPPCTVSAMPAGYMAARYDTLGSFDSAVSWSGVELTAINAACKEYAGGCFDGKYVYFSPFGRATYHGRALRIDVTKAFVASNFEHYDMTGINANCKGYSGCTFDGRYVYYAPTNNGAYHGYVVRYDTLGAFTAAGSWATFNLVSINSSYKGYVGCAFDGKYVYFGPYVNTSQHGLLTRYDIGLPFNSAAAWSVFNLTTINSAYKGYAGVVHDGQNIYLIPWYNGTEHGYVVKSSTKAGRSSTRLRGWNTSGKTAIENQTPELATQYAANVTHHAGAVDASLGAYALLVDRNTLYAAVGHFPALRDGAAIFAVDLLSGIEGLAFQYEVLEQGICDLHLYDGKVYSPGTDEIEGAAAGNYYIGQDGVWTKKQVVTSAAHVFGACHDNLGRLYLAGAVANSIPNGDYMWDTENEGVAVNEHGTSVAGYRCFSVLALASDEIYVTGNTAANETSGVLIYAVAYDTYDTQVADVVPACRARLVEFDGKAICADSGLESLWQVSGGVGTEFALPFTIPSPTILSYSGYSLYNPMCVHGEYLYVLGTTGVWRTPDLMQWEKVLDTSGTYISLALWQNRIILADVGVRPKVYMTGQIWPT